MTVNNVNVSNTGEGRTVKKMMMSVTFITSLLMATLSFAEVVTCTGKVNQLSNDVPDGFFMSVADSGVIKICNPEQDSHSVTPQNCKHIASLAALAYATGKNLTVTVDNAPTTQCAGLPDDHDSDISYVGILPQ